MAECIELHVKPCDNEHEAESEPLIQATKEPYGYACFPRTQQESDRRKLYHLEEYELNKTKAVKEDTQAPPTENELRTLKEKKEHEQKMDKVLASGEFDIIAETINVQNLTKCKTNCLEKSFQVSHKLKKLADTSYPYSQEFLNLANKVEDFTIKLVEPLKGDDMKRAIFAGEDFARICEKIILFKQKKFISHPMVYNLLEKSWKRKLYEGGKHKPWKNIKSTIIWFLLFFWTFIDFFLFPLIFALLYLIKLLSKVFQKECHAVVIMKPSSAESKEEMKSFTSSLFLQLRPEQTTYIGNQTTANDTFMGCLLKASEEFNDLEKSIKKSTRKLLIIMTDDRLDEPLEHLTRESRRIENDDVRIFTVGFGVHTDIKKLVTMATNHDNYLYHGDVNLEKLVQKMIKSIRNESLFDRYYEYFNTPYVVYERDTFSYFNLLFWHLHLCFAPSPFLFDFVQIFILFLITGRIFMEIHQALMEKRLGDKVGKPSREHENWMRESLRMSISGGEDDVKIFNHKQKRGICRIFVKIINAYLSDWWNILDMAIVIVYIVTLTLRMFGWLKWFFSLATLDWASFTPFENNRVLAVSGYGYALNTMLITLRVFGHIMESHKSTGAIQIALFHIFGSVVTIFGQFTAVILAFSLAITKVYEVEKIYKADFNSTFYQSAPFFSYDAGRLNAGIQSWLSNITHLIWSVLGIADVDPYQTGDGPSDIIAQFLYGIYLLMAAVMLMNMMIALLSNTYQDVEDHAFFEWSYRRATAIRTYVNYHPIPVPYNIFSFAFIILRRFLKFVFCNKFCVDGGAFLRNVTLRSDVRMRGSKREKKKVSKKPVSFFDCLVYDLQDEYVSKHGYAFPGEESSKIPPRSLGTIPNQLSSNIYCGSSEKRLSICNERKEQVEMAQTLEKVQENIENLRSKCDDFVESQALLLDLIRKLESRFDQLEVKLQTR